MHPLIKTLVITIYIDHRHISLLKGKEKILHKLLCENGSFFSYLSFAFWLPAVQHEHEQFFFLSCHCWCQTRLADQSIIVSH